MPEPRAVDGIATHAPEMRGAVSRHAPLQRIATRRGHHMPPTPTGGGVALRCDASHFRGRERRVGTDHVRADDAITDQGQGVVVLPLRLARVVTLVVGVLEVLERPAEEEREPRRGAIRRGLGPAARGRRGRRNGSRRRRVTAGCRAILRTARGRENADEGIA